MVVSVVAQGIFENYIDRMRDRAPPPRPGIDDVIVSANHNESSPDTVGIYGAPPTPDTSRPRRRRRRNSGIDDYYMDYLVERVAHGGGRRLRPPPAGLLCASASSRLPADV